MHLITSLSIKCLWFYISDSVLKSALFSFFSRLQTIENTSLRFIHGSAFINVSHLYSMDISNYRSLDFIGVSRRTSVSMALHFHMQNRTSIYAPTLLR